MEKKLSIIGFGNQAKAWALNLRDSGFQIYIHLREDSSSIELARNLGFQVISLDAPFPCKQIALLTPDDTHFDIAKTLTKALKGQKATLIFAHGFSLLYQGIANNFPEFNCLLLAPKAIASEVRMQYETKGKLGALYSVELSQNPEGSYDLIKSIADHLGITSLHQSALASETKADLFSEQVLLCSTLPYAALFAFNKLIEKGIEKETAYFECWHEMKLIADTMVRLGPEKFFDLISPNALAGSEIGRSALFGEDYMTRLESIYQSIDNGDFTRQLEETNFPALREKVSSFWKEQELTKTHERMGKELA